MSTATYIYVAEISTVRARGVLAALGPALVSFGIFLVYLLGSYFHWKTVAIVSAAISMIAPALLQWVPESPLWLASKGRLAEAYRAMTWIRQNAAMAHNELDDLYKGTTVLRDSVPDKLKSICRVSVLKPFLILLVFFMFQELSGIYIILYYAVDFIKSVGTNMNEFTASIIVGGLRVFMGIIGVALISNFSRRVLAITSGILLSATMLTAAMYGQPVVKLLCILCHVCASMIGFLQLPWIMSGELFPQKIRGIMSGTISSCAYLLIFTNIKTYPNLVALITNNGTLYLFGSCALLGAAFCYFFLPETKGKSLAEITREFEENNMKNDIETDVITYTNNSFDPEFTVTRRKSSAPNIFTIVLNEKGTNKRKLSI